MNIVPQTAPTGQKDPTDTPAESPQSPENGVTSNGTAPKAVAGKYPPLRETTSDADKAFFQALSPIPEDERTDGLVFTLKTPAEYDAAYGQGTYERDSELIDRGRGRYLFAEKRGMRFDGQTYAEYRAAILEYLYTDKKEARGQTAASHPVYEAAEKRLPPPPADTRWERAYQGMEHEALRHAWKNYHDEALPQRLLTLAEVDTTPPKVIVAPFLRDEGATILFGDGGGMKSTLAAAIAVATATDAHFAALQREGAARPVILLPYEGRRGLVRRVRGFARGGDTSLIRVVPERLMLGTIWDDAETLRQYIDAEFKDHGGPAGLLVVDSVAYAIGGEGAISDISATQFSTAVERIGRPALCTAHQTKAGETQKPFGSSYWHNGARMTWHDDRDKVNDVLTLRCRKDNEGEMLGQARALEVLWDDEEDNTPRDVRAVEGSRDGAAQAMYTYLLGIDSKTVADVAAATNLDDETVRKTFGRHPELFHKATLKRPITWSTNESDRK